MPAIRDSTVATESFTLDGGLTIPMCDYAEGDLLFMVLVGDSGTPTVGISSGGTWYQLFQRVNSCNLTVLWKYAAASEPASVTVTATVNDTYSGAMISVRDVFAGYTSGSPPLKVDEAQAAAVKFALPTVTTTVDNCLVLALSANSSSTAHVHMTGSTLHHSDMVDGTDEGLGIGWFFQQTAGATATPDVFQSANASGVKAVIEIKPPAGGAQVVPAYVSADDSIFLSILPNFTWDGNTAFTGDAAAAFGSTINGVSCSTNATAGIATTTNIDKRNFTRMSYAASAAGTIAMQGATFQVGSSRYNVGTRNILTHFRHDVLSSNRSLASFASGRGIWFGMRSGTTAQTNYKVWHVHAADCPMPAGYIRPIIINVANTDAIATAGTLSNSDVRMYGLWHGTSDGAGKNACFSHFWALGTITVVGGSISEPVSVEGVYRATAESKVRFSALLQGSRQVLLMQAIQFGNGGTNEIILDLDATAIEFPSQRDTTNKLCNYNGIDNGIGLTYYAGSTDTIRHTNAVISSSSPYHWKIHASASASATWDFSGLNVIGAGDVVLKPVTTFDGMTFSGCGKIDATGCALTNGTVKDPSAGTGMLITAASSLTGIAFSTAAAADYALEIAAAGTFTLTGVTFTGFTTDINVTATTGTVTINVTGGDTPTYTSAGATVSIVSGATLTLTGLVTGSDIVILNAGTSTERVNVDAHGSTSYAYTYTTGGSIDIGVFKVGYVPYYIRNYTLSGTDSSVPVSQVIDRNYLNPA